MHASICHLADDDIYVPKQTGFAQVKVKISLGYVEKN